MTFTSTLEGTGPYGTLSYPEGACVMCSQELIPGSSLEATDLSSL